MIEKKFKKKFLLLFILLTVFWWWNGIHAQSGRGKGRLHGLVVDEAGNAVANAGVHLVWDLEPTVSRDTQTDQHGKFTLPDLAAGDWEIQVIANGYTPSYIRVKIQPLGLTPLLHIPLLKPVKAVIGQPRPGSGALLEKAHQLFDAARYAEARTLYEKFLTLHPGFYPVHLYSGDCYKAVGAYEKAMAEYRKVIDAKDEIDVQVQSQAYVAAGEIYLRQNNLETAVVYFDRALERNPEATLAYHLGQVFFAENRPGESIRYFQRAADLNTGWGDPHLKLGYIYLNCGDPPGAIASFKKFLELSPQSDQVPGVERLIKKLSKTLD